MIVAEASARAVWGGTTIGHLRVSEHPGTLRACAQVFAVLLLLLCRIDPVMAQPAPTAAATAAAAPAAVLAPIKVGVFVSPPFIMKEKDGYTGFTYDLWVRIANDLKLPFEVQEISSVTQLLDMVRNHQIDVAATSLSITAPRYATMDFSQPYFDSGLRIMIDEDRHASMGNLMTGLAQGGHLRIYAWLVGIMIVATIVLTLIDRRYHPEFPEKWSEGVAESFYHVMSVVTSGTTSHRNLLGTAGRFLGALWLACGVATVAYITSSITSVMTVATMNHQINGPADLGGKAIGVLPGTTGEAFGRDAQLNVQTFVTMEDAVDALLKGHIAAIVRDAPVLEWYDQTHPNLPLTEVGPLFKPEKYGFAMPQGSPLTRPISEELLRLKDHGEFEELRKKYFGQT
jgi:ABC-type amino acid transport substrate-binding protein